MNEDDTRFHQILSALDDARTGATDLLEALPSTDLRILPLKRIQRHCNRDIKLLQAGGRLPTC
jgi:hypothetical protein